MQPYFEVLLLVFPPFFITQNTRSVGLLAFSYWKVLELPVIRKNEISPHLYICIYNKVYTHDTHNTGGTASQTSSLFTLEFSRFSSKDAVV